MDPNDTPNMDSVDHEELEDALLLHYRTKLPLFVHGAPGIGKSVTAEDVGEHIADQESREFVDYTQVYDPDDSSMDGTKSSWDLSGKVTVDELKDNPEDYFVLVDLRLSQEDPTTSKGIPSTDGLSTSWSPPKWLNILSLEGIDGLLFADELNQAHPDVQAAYFQLVQKRQLSGRRLSDGVLVVSAGNREKDEANVSPIPAPLRNRYAAHVNLVPPTNKEWEQWARDFNQSVQDDDSENQIDFSVIQFIGSEVGASYLFEEIGDNPDKSAFQTPRTWQYAGQQLSEYRKMSDEFDLDDAKDIVQRAVGNAAANSYKGYIEASQDIDLQRLFENPEKVNDLKVQNLNVNTMHILSTTISNYYNRVISGNDEDSPVEALENIFLVLEAIPKEYRTAIVSDLKQVDDDLMDHFNEADVNASIIQDMMAVL
jgi:hypothetical protein